MAVCFLCVQASFLTKKLNIAGRRATLSIWDTAGQERFHALGPIYYRDSNGAILVYDITDEDSFQKVGKQVVFDMRGGYWHQRADKGFGNPPSRCNREPLMVTDSLSVLTAVFQVNLV